MTAPTILSRALAYNHKNDFDDYPHDQVEPTLFGSSTELSERFDTSADITAFCRAQKIQPPSKQMRNIRLNIPLINVQASRHHCFDLNHMKYLDRVEHPMRKTIFDLYAARAGNPLWHSAQAYGAKPVVCSKAKRWLQRGIREALTERGYDREGRPVKGSDGKAPPPLRGTLKLVTHAPRALCALPFPKVLAKARRALAGAEPLLVQEQGGMRSYRQGSQDASKPHQAFRKTPMGKRPPPRGL